MPSNHNKSPRRSWRPVLVTVLLAALLPGVLPAAAEPAPAAQTPPLGATEGLSAEGWAAIQAGIDEDQLSMRPVEGQPGAYEALLHGQGLQATIGGEGIEVLHVDSDAPIVPIGWNGDLALVPCSRHLGQVDIAPTRVWVVGLRLAPPVVVAPSWPGAGGFEMSPVGGWDRVTLGVYWLPTPQIVDADAFACGCAFAEGVPHIPDRLDARRQRGDRLRPTRILHAG